MWLLPSMNRPKAAQAVLDACWQKGMRQKAVLFVDGDPTEYQSIKLPDNWKMYAPGKRMGLTHSMNWAYYTYPKETHYGWLADDTFPETMNFADIIEEETGKYNFTCCYDKWIMDESQKQCNLVRRGALMTSGLCWGSGLLKFAGWWAYPSVLQVGIDWIWTELLKDTGISKYLKNVTVRHDNFKTGRRKYDETDDTIYQEDYKKDYALAQHYIRSTQFEALRLKLIEKYKETHRVPA